jgi:hypothetical protein
MFGVPGQSPPHDGNDHRPALPGRIGFLFALSTRQGRVGGARRDRTDDLKLAKLALSQLSYGPNPQIHQTSSCETAPDALVGLERFELSTSRLSSARSNQLSYRPGKRGVMSMRRKRNEDGGVPRFISRSTGLAEILPLFQVELRGVDRSPNLTQFNP